jgi:signal transduction histidine kinase
MRHVRASSLRQRLVLLVLSVLIPALLTAGLLLGNAYRQERQSLSRQMSETAHAMSLVVDRQIGQQRMLLTTLATSPSLAAGDWKAFDGEARAATRGTGAWVAVAEETGVQRVNTYVPFGSVLPKRSMESAGVTWVETPGDPVRVSNLFSGRVSRLQVVVLETRVARSEGTRVRLAAMIPAAGFSRVLDDQGFPPGWLGSIADAQGVIVARSRDPEAFVGRSASAAMLERMRHAASGVAPTRTLDGVPSLTAWSRAPHSGWSFVVAVPRAEIDAAASRSLLWGAMIGLGFLAIGVSLAGLVARNIARPVESLANAARGWAEGAPVTALQTGIRETDQLAGALADAALAVETHQADLRDLNASLELRVAERTRELAEATESLAQAQKLEAIGRLTGGVAHDFNNLLMAVLGNLDLLARRLTEPKHLHYVAQARAAGERGAKLTAQLLAFSRRQRLEPTPIDVAAAIEAACTLLGASIGGAYRLEVEAAPDLWPAMADATQTELMLVNLAINARDATPSGGVIRLTADNVRLDDLNDQAHAPPAGDYVRLSVSDAGEGMTPEVEARAFEPFFTTKPVGKGSGLGLPQVLGLAKALGGGVELDTAPGYGTTVRVFLPRAATAAVVDPGIGIDPVTALAGLRILLVDDDPDVRAVTGHLLVELGCRVTQADSGEAGLGLLRQDPTLEAVLIDFAMPGLNGGETATRMRTLRPDLAILLMTGFADLEDLAGAWSGPVLHKPFTAQAVALQIVRASPVVRSAEGV